MIDQLILCFFVCFVPAQARAMKHGTVEGVEGGDDGREISVTDWTRFGRCCQMYVKQAPPLSYM